MKQGVKISDSNTLTFIAALLRILVGLFLLVTWINNLGKGLYTPAGLVHFFTAVYPQSENPLHWYAAFIGTVIIPSRMFFSPFQMIAELVIAIGLLVGLWTPVVGLACIFFLVNTLLATAGNHSVAINLIPIVILLLVLVVRGGRPLGLDGNLVKRNPNLARWLF